MFKVIFRNEVYDADTISDISAFVLYHRIVKGDIKVFQGNFYKEIELFDKNGWIYHDGHFYYYNNIFYKYFVYHQPCFPKNKAIKNVKAHKIYKQKNRQNVITYDYCCFEGYKEKRSRKGRCWKDKKIKRQYLKHGIRTI